MENEDNKYNRGFSKMTKRKYLTEEEIVALIDSRIAEYHAPVEPPESELYQDENYYAVESPELREMTEEEIDKKLHWDDIKKEMDKEYKQGKRLGFWNFFWWR